MPFARLEHALFAHRAGQPRALSAVRTSGQFAWLLVRDLLQGRLNLHAMSLVYSTLIAMVPLLAFGVSALKGLGVNGVLGPALDRLLEPLGPAGSEISTRLVSFVANVNVGVLGVLGVLLLAVTAVSLVRKIEAGLNEAWNVADSPPSLARAAQYLSLLVLGPLFFFAAFGLTATVTNGSIAHRLAQWSPLLPAVLGKFLPYLLVVAGFTLINLIAPNTRVRLRAAFAAGLAGGLTWQTAGLVFAVLTARSTRLSAVYSSFAILILFLSWLYVSWLILLLGARLGFYVQNPAWRRPRSEQTPLAPAAAEAMALEIMLDAAARFAAGGRPLSLGECVGRLGVPALRLQPILAGLADAELLYRAGSRGYVLGRSPDKISVADVIAAARGRLAEEPRPHRLGELLGLAESRRAEALTGTTLAEFVTRTGHG